MPYYIVLSKRDTVSTLSNATVGMGMKEKTAHNAWRDMAARMGSVMDRLNVNASMGGKEIYVILKLIPKYLILVLKY